VLTALALAGWGVRAAGTPRSDVARNSSVSVANAPANGVDANNGQAPAANNGQAPAANNGQAQDAGGAPVQAAGIVTTKLVGKKVPKMGDVVQDGEGFTLYRFDKDVKGSGTSACQKDPCLSAWPAALVQDGQAPQLEGVDAALVSTIKREDGGSQLAIDGWPVYRYAKDPGPNKWAGQGVGQTWFVIQPNGKKNLSCLPTGQPAAPAQPAQPPANGGGNGGY
jgi:predicted lipoprotein with Yx(FWY)xxD motif